MTSFNERINRLNEKRRKIVFVYHGLKAQHPQGKTYEMIKLTAKKIGYSRDRKNGSNSFVMRVIREWNQPDSAVNH